MMAPPCATVRETRRLDTRGGSDDDDVRQTQMTPGVRGDEPGIGLDAVSKVFWEWPYSCHMGENR